MPTENNTILLIDDDPDDWYILDLAMKEIDDTIKMEFVGYCEDAIKKLAEKSINPRLIFLDLNMPKMQGDECLSHLKQLPHLKDVPVVIYSTSRRSRDKEYVLANGAAYFISKTNTFEELVDEIKDVIKPDVKGSEFI